MSIYYFLLDEFDPFVGHPREQKYLSHGFTPVAQRVEMAEEQQRAYAALRWPEIKSNLSENRLCSQETLRRFEVHYRFLSAFVHPMPAGYDLVYGRNRPTAAPRFDHYASELALLYINKRRCRRAEVPKAHDEAHAARRARWLGHRRRSCPKG